MRVVHTMYFPTDPWTAEMLSVTLDIKAGPLSNPMNNSSPNLSIISPFQNVFLPLVCEAGRTATEGTETQAWLGKSGWQPPFPGPQFSGGPRTDLWTGSSLYYSVSYLVVHSPAVKPRKWGKSHFHIHEEIVWNPPPRPSTHFQSYPGLQRRGDWGRPCQSVSSWSLHADLWFWLRHSFLQ